jgi:eukaryotic-like serine/threonine-protein kinase
MVATSSPPRVGRYDVVGRLATGGMAEVLLGRLRGPHGFERPVVIKRILPHLALDPSIVDMFLDEARIIAGLHHPNLVAVHELGHEGDDLFMAMEYLEGESVAGICRRLAARGEHIDPYVAAHVVAEACAGLHAAHEATAGDGRALGIVHRDVSPQNIFVTYAGSVHVIDFGIATTVDRISRTEAGTVRGKCEYLAPEQLQGLVLDRRADLFGLGVVLFELASGRRLYRRPSHAETFMAILNDPVPSLTALREDTPAQLEATCARALAKDRRERHQTAAELRRELLALLRKQDDDPGELLGRLMRQLFAERVDEKATMLQHVREGADLASLPAAEADMAVDLPTATAGSTTLLSQSVPLRVVDARRGAGRRWLVPSVVIAAAIAAGTMVWRSGGRASLGPSPAASLSPVVAAAVVASSSSPADPGVPAAPSSTSVALPSAAASTARAAPGPSRRPVRASPAASAARSSPTMW